MQIQCPHCKSRYRLGSEMIDAYGGFVRCGNCSYKFNIHDQVLLEDGQGELVNTGKRPSQYSEDSKKTAVSPQTTKSPRIEPRLERDEKEEAVNIRFGRGQDVEETPSQKTQNKEPLLDHSGQYTEIDGSDGFQLPESLDDLGVPMDDMYSDTFDELTERSLDQESSSEDLDLASSEPWPELDPDEKPVVFDSLRDEASETDSERLTLINSDTEDSQPETGLFRSLISILWRTIQFLFWAIVAIALAYLLFGQIKNTLYPIYKNYSLVQQVRSGLCVYLPCNETKYDVDLFEIVVSRMDEVSEPSRELHVTIFLLNKAEYEQAYPNILLALKTIDGSTVGQRVINPREYLTSYDSLISAKANATTNARVLVQPNRLGKILIKLNNPPAAAVGFEARVVK